MENLNFITAQCGVLKPCGAASAHGMCCTGVHGEGESLLLWAWLWRRAASRIACGEDGSHGLCSGCAGPIRAAQRCPGGSPFSKPRCSLHPLPPATPPGALGTPCPSLMSPRKRNCQWGDVGSIHVRRGKKSHNKKGSFFQHEGKEEPAFQGAADRTLDGNGAWAARAHSSPLSTTIPGASLRTRAGWHPHRR